MMSIGQLPRCRRRANRLGMGARVVRSLLIFTMLFGVLSAPVSAAFLPNNMFKAALLTEVECAGEDAADSNSQSPADVPGTHHHHCTHAVPVNFADQDSSINFNAARRYPALFGAMASLSQAPPTEPPSA